MSGREIFALCGWCAVCRGNGKDTRQGVVGGGRREGGVGVAMNWLAVEDSFTDKTTDYACDEGDCDSKREEHLPSFPSLASNRGSGSGVLWYEDFFLEVLAGVPC